MSSVLILCLTITLFLPLVTRLSIHSVNARLFERSRSTPILVGSKGSPFLLTFSSIYFRAEIKEKLAYKHLKRLRKTIKGKVIPLHTFHTVRGVPVVGTSFDYFTFRNLKTAQGDFPSLMGQAVVGSNAAMTLNVKAGASVITDCESLYDISAEYPLKMKITGVLAPTGTADDNAVFTDIKTAWVIDGIGHGHQNLVETNEEIQDLDLSDPNQNPDDSVLFIESSEIVYNSRLKKYNEITKENLHTFHFHGDQDELPLSAVIAAPASYEEEVVELLAKINLTKELQAIRPTKVVDEIMEILLNLKRILDGFSLMIFITTAAFMALVLSLQIQQRKNERQILYRIGGGKNMVIAILGVEALILVLISACLAVGAGFSMSALINAYLSA